MSFIYIGFNLHLLLCRLFQTDLTTTLKISFFQQDSVPLEYMVALKIQKRNVYTHVKFWMGELHLRMQIMIYIIFVLYKFRCYSCRVNISLLSVLQWVTSYDLIACASHSVTLPLTLQAIKLYIVLLLCLALRLQQTVTWMHLLWVILPKNVTPCFCNTSTMLLVQRLLIHKDVDQNSLVSLIQQFRTSFRVHQELENVHPISGVNLR